LVGAKLPANAGEDSQSFKWVLSKMDKEPERLPLINHGSSGRYSITERNWKLVLPHRREKAELYDLVSDPGETKNVIASHRNLAARLQQKITAIVVNGRTTAGVARGNDTGHWKDLSWMTPEEYRSKRN
jgi:arylsulfatase A